METTVIKRIFNFIFGYRYYAAVLNTKGVVRSELSSKIFRTREEADAYCLSMETNLTYKIVEIVSFRSRNDWYRVPDELVKR